MQSQIQMPRLPRCCASQFLSLVGLRRSLMSDFGETIYPSGLSIDYYCYEMPSSLNPLASDFVPQHIPAQQSSRATAQTQLPQIYVDIRRDLAILGRQYDRNSQILFDLYNLNLQILFDQYDRNLQALFNHIEHRLIRLEALIARNTSLTPAEVRWMHSSFILARLSIERQFGNAQINLQAAPGSPSTSPGMDTTSSA